MLITIYYIRCKQSLINALINSIRLFSVNCSVYSIISNMYTILDHIITEIKKKKKKLLFIVPKCNIIIMLFRLYFCNIYIYIYIYI
uniref:Uncharacterized protein n=1 Tax=Heterorhabditis bacteriophora TaxID=37862 RepID=A0A1I7X1P1_HETBA